MTATQRRELLQSLVECLDRLSASESTGTTRAKAMSTLRDLLQNAELVRLLDECTTDEENRPLLTWDTVIHHAFLYLRRQIERLLQRVSKSKSKALPSCSAGEDVRWLIGKADGRGPMLQNSFAMKSGDKSINLFDEILQPLTLESAREFVRADLIDILLKHLLPVRCYAVKLRLKQAASLLTVFMGMVRTNRGQNLETGAARGIYMLLAQSTESIQEKLLKYSTRPELERFFREVLRGHFSPEVGDHPISMRSMSVLVVACTTFCRHIAMEAHGTLLEFAMQSDIVGAMAQFLMLSAADRRTNAELRDEAVHFFRLVILAANSRYGKVLSVMQILDKKLYKDKTKGLLELVKQHRGRRKSKEEVLSLEASVASVLDLIASLAAGHAEAISVERLEQELTPKAKRRRVMVDPWEEILAEMSHNQLDEQELLPWLQFAGIFLKKFPKSLSAELGKVVLEQAVSIVTTIRGELATAWCLSLLEAVSCCAQAPVLDWDWVLRNLIEHWKPKVLGTHPPVYQLLASLAAHGHISFDDGLTRLIWSGPVRANFSLESGVSLPHTLPAIKFAITVVNCCPSKDLRASSGLALPLIKWVVGNIGRSQEQGAYMHSDAAMLLGLLCLKEPANLSLVAVPKETSRSFLSESETALHDIEETLLLTDTLRSVPAGGSEPSVEEATFEATKTNLMLWQQACELLTHKCQAALDAAVADLEGQSLLGTFEQAGMQRVHNVPRTGQRTMANMCHLGQHLGVVLGFLSFFQDMGDAVHAAWMALDSTACQIAMHLTKQYTALLTQTSRSFSSLIDVFETCAALLSFHSHPGSWRKLVNIRVQPAGKESARIAKFVRCSPLQGHLEEMVIAAGELILLLLREDEEEAQNKPQSNDGAGVAMETDDFEAVETPAAAGTGIDSEALSALAWGPTRLLHHVVLAAVDLLHAWRSIACSSVFGQDRPDAVGDILCALAMNETAPLCVAVAAGGSLGLVAAPVITQRVEHATAVLRLLCHEESGLCADSSFFEPSCRVTCLQLLARIAPTIVATPILKADEALAVLLSKFFKQFVGKPTTNRSATSQPPVWHYGLSPRVRMAWMNCLAAFFAVDPAGRWLEHQRSRECPPGDHVTWTMDTLQRFLRDRHQLVRMHAARVTASLFAAAKQHNAVAVELFCAVQFSFQSVLNALIPTARHEDQTCLGFDYPGDESHPRGKLEREHHTTTALVTLGELACVYRPREKTLIYWLLCDGYGRHALIVGDVVKRIAASLGFASDFSLIQSCLPSLLFKWARNAPEDDPFLFASFPCVFVDKRYAITNGAPPSSCKMFLKDTALLWFPILVQLYGVRSKWHVIDTTCKHIGIKRDDLFIRADIWPRTMAILLALKAVRHGDETEAIREGSDRVLSHMTALKLRAPSWINPDVVCDVLLELALICHISDEKTDSARHTVEPDELSIQPTVINAVLRMMCTKNGSKNVAETLLKHPAKVQELLLAQSYFWSCQHRPAEQVRALFVYRFVVCDILNEHGQLLGAGAARTPSSYYFREMVHTVCRALRSQPAIFSESLELLHRLCQIALTTCPGVLAEHLRLIINALPSDQAQLGWAESRDMEAFFRLLFEQGAQSLEVAIAELEPECLPQWPFLQQAYQAARMEHTEDVFHGVLRLTRAGPTESDSSRIARLRSLCNQLPAQREHLAAVAPADRATLLVALLRLASSSSTPAARQLAATCLGELGSVDMPFVALATAVREDMPSDRLGPAHVAGKQGRSQRLSQKGVRSDLLHYIVASLHGYLVDDNVLVARAAGKALKNMFRNFRAQPPASAGAPLLQDLAAVFDTETDEHGPITVAEVYDQAFVSVACDVDALGLSCWVPTAGQSHQVWITRLTLALIQGADGESYTVDPLLQQMHPLCQRCWFFCEGLFPYVVYFVLASDSPKQRLRQHLSANVRQLLDAWLQSPTPAKESITTVLNLLQFLRGCDRLPSTMPSIAAKVLTPYHSNFWLDLNGLVVARAAMACSAHFTCLYFLELDQEICVPTEEMGREAQRNELLARAYTRIGEPDSVYGLQTTLDLSEIIRTYEHEGRWDQALDAYDLLACAAENGGGAYYAGGVARSLQALGRPVLLDTFLAGSKLSSALTPELAEYRREACWRSSLWKIQEDCPETLDCFVDDWAADCFHGNLLCLLNTFRTGDMGTFFASLDATRCLLVEQLTNSSVESVYAVQPLLAKFQCIREVEETWLLLYPGLDRRISQSTQGNNSLPSAEDPLTLLGRLRDAWHHRLQAAETSWQTLDMVLTLRCVLLKMVVCLIPGQSCQPLAERLLLEHLLHHAELGRAAGRFQGAFLASSVLKSKDVFLAELENAKTHWARAESVLALRVLNGLLVTLSASSDGDGGGGSAQSTLPGIATSLLGQWLAKTRSQSTRVVEAKLTKGLQLLIASQSTCDNVGEDSETLQSETCSAVLRATLALARFADEQYKLIVEKEASTDYGHGRLLREIARKELEELQKRGNERLTHAERRRRVVLERRAKIEVGEEKTRQQQRKQFLSLAVQNYAECLALGEDFDTEVFRLCSLWFTNSGDQEINACMASTVARLPSAKWLLLIYQIAARLDAQPRADKRPMAEIVASILRRVGVDHPFHVVYVLIALSNGGHPMTDCKAAAAQQVLSFLSQQGRIVAGQSLSALIPAMQALSVAFIELAQLPVKKDEASCHTGRFGLCKIDRKLSHVLESIPVITKDLDVDVTGRYNDVVGTKRFERSFELAGGINLPKIIICVGTDGRSYKQVVKGNDDMRQDAVMQQVFRMVNRWLGQDVETNKRQLKVPTYRIVPLSQQAGVLEWCEDTVPLGQWLVHGSRSTPGAHTRYRPQDTSAKECRALMQNVRERPERLPIVFQNVCTQFQPVMRYFFTELFRDPALWFERRLAYTRSVAANSIVGFVLGLGDRHPHNILISKKTAELVHIDLGVAFDQGKILPTPETVPFRLTRDIVDGMGITGVEGVFRRCCEESLRVLRGQQASLTTILEVFLYDPLFAWQLSTEKAAQRQHQEEEDESMAGQDAVLSGSAHAPTAQGQEAYRVLLQVRHKLEGYDSGTPLSVQGHVQHLIQEATSPENLCRVFAGWQPWV